MREAEIRIDFATVGSAKDFLDDLSEGDGKDFEVKLPRTKGFNQDASWVEFILMLFEYGATITGPAFGAYLKSLFDKKGTDQSGPKSITLRRGKSKLEVDLQDGLADEDRKRIEKFLSDEKD